MAHAGAGYQLSKQVTLNDHLQPAQYQLPNLPALRLQPVTTSASVYNNLQNRGDMDVGDV